MHDINERYERYGKCKFIEVIDRRLRTKAIKSYCNEVSLELNDNPRRFFSTFSPFISSKGQKETNEDHLNIKDKIKQDQQIVAEEFADYFSTVADAIGGEANNLTEEKCINHRGIEMIQARHEADSFSFNKLNERKFIQLLKNYILERLLGTKVLKLVAKEIATPLTDIFNQVMANGLKNGKGENGFRFIRRTIVTKKLLSTSSYIKYLG